MLTKVKAVSHIKEAMESLEEEDDGFDLDDEDG